MSTHFKDVIAAYFAANGSKGGKKSRRKLAKKEARRIANIRWGKNK